MDFDYLKTLFMKGDMPAAIEYLDRYEDGREMAEQYRDLFEREHYLTYDIPEAANAVLLEYQKYYRDVFYLLIPEDTAASALAERLRKLLVLPSDELSALEDGLKALFEKNGLHILTGKTNGHRGPYVWRDTEPAFFDVELPGGMRRYQVNILRGFVMRSWMDYLTFGKFGTGGWTDENGIINCIAKAYDFGSKRFQISLLKHEAQHAEDLSRWPDMPSEALEYRAKLVELIYSGDAELLCKFCAEADGTRKNDGHAMASARISEEMGTCRNSPPEEITNRAKELLAANTREWEEKVR